MEIDRLGVAGCPDPEDLAAYVDGHLHGTARSHVEWHLADCAPCRLVVTESVALARERVAGDPGQLWGLPRRRAYAAAGVTLALAASLLVIARVDPVLLPFGQDHYGDLVRAVGTTRTVEARVTGGFEYAPLRAITRSAANAATAEDFRLLAANGELQEEALENPSPANRHAAGVGQLVIGDPDRAVTLLQSAVSDEPGEARYHSDLAAAYFSRGRASDDANDFVKARAAAAEAIALDPSLDEAYFNEALALEALGRRTDAQRAYERALARDATSPWNSEIRMRLQRLRP
jgi:tetratricopeptide (TPR) repeat protein